MQLKYLMKSSFIYTFGSLFIKGITIFTIPIFTRVMDKASFGDFALYSSWVAIFSIFLGLKTVSALNIGKRDYEQEYGNYMTTALSISTVTFTILFWVVFLFKGELANLLGFPSGLVLILVIQSFFTYITEFIGAYLVFEKKSTSYTIVTGISTIATMFLSIYLVLNYQNEQLLGRVFGMLIPSGILTIVAMFYLYNKERSFITTKFVNEILVISLPIIPHTLGHVILTQLDRIMIDKYIGVNATAEYSFGYNLALLINIVWVSLNNAWVPWYFEQEKKLGKNVGEFCKIYIVFFALLTIGFLYVSPEFTYLMGGKEYIGAVKFLPLIIVSYFFVFLYSFPVNVQFMNKNTKFIPVATFLAAISNFLINLVFIKKYGILGAAYATAISYFILFVLHYLVVKVRYNYSEVQFRYYLYWVAYVMANVGVYYLCLDKVVLRYSILVINVIVLAVILFKKGKLLKHI